MEKSRLVLGTVQLGMKYGLNNTHGQPTRDESFAILDTALAQGINTFDTGYAYGEAEDVLGAWISDRGVADKINVISKMKPHALNDYLDGTPATHIVRAEIKKSLQRLKIGKLDGYLLHSPHYIYLTHVVAALRQVRAEGLVDNIGVSIYDEQEALQAVELPLDYVQVPYNIFDTRLERTDFFDIAKRNNVRIFARSPFLQGLLLMNPDHLPTHLAHARPFLEEFIKLAEELNIFRTTLSMAFAYNNSALHHIVFGVETVDQLKEDLEITSNSAVQPSQLKNVKDKFQNISRAIVSPSLWSRIKK